MDTALRHDETPVLSFTQVEFHNATPEFYVRLQEAIRRGFFYLEIPMASQALLEDARTLGNTFYEQPTILNRPKVRWSGYHKKEESQKESLYVENTLWHEWLPNPVAMLATQMHELSVDLTRKALQVTKVPEKLWLQGTGGGSEGSGGQHFFFNHYRPEEPLPGLNPHRDFGLLTLLFIEKAGLEAQIDGRWVAVSPKKGYFVVNVGRALETFVNDSTKVNACWHKVERVYEDRISFGLSTDNNYNSSIYKMESNGSTTLVQKSYVDYINDCFQETYKGDFARFCDPRSADAATHHQVFN
jgi:isopenicillin N synthase-like dioxygenase